MTHDNEELTSISQQAAHWWVVLPFARINWTSTIAFVIFLALMTALTFKRGVAPERFTS